MAKRRRPKSQATADSGESVFDVEVSEPSQNLADYVIWIYGEPGIGKSSLASRFGDTFHFMFGDRDVSLRVKKRQFLDWGQFERATEEWLTRTDFSCGVVDVVDEAYECCFDFMCSGIIEDPWGNKVEHPTDANDMGKSWKKIRRRFTQPINRLVAADQGLILLSHSKYSERKTAEGEELEDVHPAISGQAMNVIYGLSDIVGYYHIRAGERVLQIQPTNGIVAKCRPEENFRYTDGTPIRSIPMGKSADEAYENFQNAFLNRLDPPQPKSKPSRRRRSVTKEK